MFRPAGTAPTRATRVQAVLEDGGHQVSARRLARSPAALLRVIRDSPDVIHACGSDAWGAASLAALVTRACVVYEPLDGGGGARSRRPEVARA